MTNEQINAAIAEACGWKVKKGTRKGKFDPEGVCLWYELEHHGGESIWRMVPDFTNSLDAMHKAEESLKGIQFPAYAFILDNFEGSLFGIRATARQRAEAFLRTLGKWEEGE
jgi:hypothetical protein